MPAQTNKRKGKGKRTHGSISQAGPSENTNDLWEQVRATNTTVEGKSSTDAVPDNASDNGTVASGDLVDPTTRCVTVAPTVASSTTWPIDLQLDLTKLPKDWTEAKKSSNRDRRSAVWNYAFEIQDPNGKNFWLCKLCHSKGVNNRVTTHRYDGKTTSNQWLHMRRKHHILPDGSKDLNPDSVISLLTSSSASSSGSKLEGMVRSLTTSFDYDAFKFAFIEWVVRDNITLRQSTSPAFHSLIQQINVEAAKKLSSSHNTTRSWILKTYAEQKKQVIESIATANSKISISFDGWKADTGMDFLGICAHYIDADFQSHDILIAMVRIHGKKTGENHAKLARRVLEEYKITTPNLGWFVLDNASDNDTAVEALAKSYDIFPKQHRLRCAGHIINLVAEAFLFSADPAGLNKSICDAKTDEELLGHWRARGPIGKLHNLVYHITRTSARRDQFAEAQKEQLQQFTTKDWESDKVYALVKDGGVRWNSAYMMIDRALKLNHALITFPFSQKDQSIQADALDRNEWSELTEFKEILEPLFLTTKALEQCATEDKKEGLLYQVVPVFLRIRESFLGYRTEYEHRPNSESVRTGLDNAIAKLEDYLEKFSRSHAWYAAVVLHPGIKWGIFRSYYDKEKLYEAEKLVKSAWRRFYRSTASEDHIREPPRKLGRFDFAEALITSSIRESDERGEAADEYERYCAEKCDESCTNPVQWWRDHAHMYPHLCRYAFDMLAIPAMSAECERTFSKAGYAISPRRSQLGEDIIEASECLKSWITKGVWY